VPLGFVAARIRQGKELMVRWSPPRWARTGLDESGERRPWLRRVGGEHAGLVGEVNVNRWPDDAGRPTDELHADLVEATTVEEVLAGGAGWVVTGQRAGLGRQRLVDDVVGVLRERIVRGELPAGCRLLQVDLADQLGVSRTPLREALRVLEHDGWVRIANNNRTVEVVGFDAAVLRDLFEVREVIDGLAARLAAGRGLSAATETQGRRLLADMAGSVVPFDPLRRADVHAEFHLLFVEASGNQRLRGLIPLIRMSTAGLYRPVLDDPDVVEVVAARKATTPAALFDETQASHQAIFDAVVAGHARQAEAAARRHIRRISALVDSFDEWARAIPASPPGQSMGSRSRRSPPPSPGPSPPRSNMR
jgi:GntR family transcriptional regulator, vanillate catabolism transcriptional regulator